MKRPLVEVSVAARLGVERVCRVWLWAPVSNTDGWIRVDREVTSVSSIQGEFIEDSVEIAICKAHADAIKKRIPVTHHHAFGVVEMGVDLSFGVEPKQLIGRIALKIARTKTEFGKICRSCNGGDTPFFVLLDTRAKVAISIWSTKLATVLDGISIWRRRGIVRESEDAATSRVECNGCKSQVYRGESANSREI